MKKMFFILFLVLVLGGSFAGLWFWNMWTQSYQGQPQSFLIQSGDPFSRINHRLYQRKLIHSPRLFHWLAKMRNQMTSLRPGLYQIEPGMTSADILEMFRKGRFLTYSVTIPEGKNLYQIAQILKSANIQAKNFLALAKDPKSPQAFGFSLPSMEGLLFPDTYRFSPMATGKEIIKAMGQNFVKKWAKIKSKRGLSKLSTKLSAEKLVTLASIVEKETGAAWERPRIAGVFFNRLKKGMRLQSDPTTIYGIWERFDGNIRRKDLLEKTAYNTYKISGLPKGPICNPGTAALTAVQEPENHDYLYFVSKNDGTHEFTPTYKLHLKAVENFQLNRSQRRGKSWRDLKKKKTKR